MRKIYVALVLAVVAIPVLAVNAMANHSEACANDGPNQASVLVGDDHDNCIRGGNANDEVYGLGGNDRLGGNHGKDLVVGGEGDDRIFGGRGPDTLDGGPGYDKCFSRGRGDNDTFIDCEVVDGERA